MSLSGMKSVRTEFGEIDYNDNHADLDERLIKILEENESMLDITTDFEL